MRTSNGSKKRGYTGKLILILLAALLLFSGFTVYRDVTGKRGTSVDFSVDIPDGAGTNQIAGILKNRGIIKHPLIFKVYSKLSGSHMYKKGVHALDTTMSYGEIFAELDKNAEAKGEKLTIPEGYEARQIADLISEKGLGSRDEFINEMNHGVFSYDFVNSIPRTENRLEGYLYPSTYTIAEGTSVHDIIDMMLAGFERNVVPVYNESDSEQSLDDIITLASIVEREAANDDERGKVASVFVNRMKKDMKLESCATVQYILKERKTILSNADTAIDSKYNTYKYAGLPEGPIASPGLLSVKAALHPDDTGYYYFLAVSDGSKNLFSETFDEHNEKLRQEQGKNGNTKESGDE